MTDIAKHKSDDPAAVIGNWMRNRNTIEYLGIWEILYNPLFNPLEFEGVRKEAGLNEEFQRLKEQEAEQIGWSAKRELSKINIIENVSCEQKPPEGILSHENAHEKSAAPYFDI